MAIINFSMDYLALYITAKIMHIKQKNRRLTIAAIIGSLYSLFIIATNITSGLNAILSLLAAFAMTFAAFGKQKPSLFAKNTAVFYVVSFSLGGGITAICNLLNMWQNSRGVIINGTFDTLYGDIPFGLLALTAAVCGLFSYISGKIIKGRVSQKVCELEVCVKANSIAIQALVDSGNLLKEPISSKPVVIIAFEAVRPILPMDIFNVLKNKGTIIPDSILRDLKIRFIPTSTVGGNGLLYAFCPDYIKINGRAVDAYLAVDSSQNNFGDFRAIVPNDLTDG